MKAAKAPGEEDKERGNAFFNEGKWGKAYQSYTAAIQADPNNHIYYSNRCACFLKLNKDSKALADAEKCIELKPNWPKGYFRKACALSELLRHGEALIVLNVAIDFTLNDNQNLSAEISTKLKDLVERMELNQDKNIIKVSEEHNTIISKEEYDSFITKMKAGTEQKLTEEQIDTAFMNLWTCAIGRIQIACINKSQVRLPFVIFHSGYSAEGSTALLPITKPIELVSSFVQNLTDVLPLNYIMVVVHKMSANGLPWEKNSKNAQWKHKKRDGVFIQIDTPTKSGIYFIPIGQKRKGIITFAADQIEPLEWSSFAILPRILHKH